MVFSLQNVVSDATTASLQTVMGYKDEGMQAFQAACRIV
jgi:hypothetical protein